MPLANEVRPHRCLSPVFLHNCVLYWPLISNCHLHLRQLTNDSSCPVTVIKHEPHICAPASKHCKSVFCLTFLNWGWPSRVGQTALSSLKLIVAGSQVLCLLFLIGNLFTKVSAISFAKVWRKKFKACGIVRERLSHYSRMIGLISRSWL